jgi:5-methyltetrahydropteroyltriglutamate--homocysteine methyltransferase
LKTSVDRILTTHVGSIPRPEGIRELLRKRLQGSPVDEDELASRVTEATVDVIRSQVNAGIDIVCDGEMGKTSYVLYADERLTGFTQLKPDDPDLPPSNLAGSWSRRIGTRREWAAFRDYYETYLPMAMPASAPPTMCTGPIEYKGEELLKTDLANLRNALAQVDVEEAFITSVAPAMVGRGQNRFYATEDDFRYAVADALKNEYKAIVDAGFILQIDDPGLGVNWGTIIPEPPVEDYRRSAAMTIEVLNYALKGIPEDRVRYHLCWGSWQGPHTGDLELKDLVDIMLGVNAQAYSVEAATPRHSFEWQIWEHVKLPDDKILIPGVIAHTTAVVEHPETVAERLMNYAGILGRERVIAGADCGFAQGALYERQHPSVMWAKFEAMATGAALASERLWAGERRAGAATSVS